MTRRSGSSDAIFYFQAWHVDKVVNGESWLQNKAFADFVEQNLIGNARRWLFVKACVPTKERAGLLVPYSICVKLRSAKIGQNPEDADRAILQFRDKEFPSIARSYFLTRLRKSLDFFNAYAENIESEPLLANFEVVKSSTQLKERVQAAIRYVKRESWGDLIHGLVDGGSLVSDFKASRFISKRGQDPIDPYQLPTAPLDGVLLPLCNDAGRGSNDFPPMKGRAELPAIEASSTDGSISDGSSDCSSSDETSQSSVAEDSSECGDLSESSECEIDDSKVSVVEDAVQVGAAKASTQSSTAYQAAMVHVSRAATLRSAMPCTMSQDSQTAFFVLRNAGSWLQSLVASRTNGGQEFGVFDSPIILAATISPLQAAQPDGMMRVFFMSQAKRQREEMVRDKNGQLVRRRKGKATREWVVGSAKVSTRALTKHLQRDLENQRFLPAAASPAREVDSVVGPNNRLIEMIPAPDIPQAIIVSSPPAVEIKDGDIVQTDKEDGFVYIETKSNQKVVEIELEPEVVVALPRRKEKRPEKSRSKGKQPYVKSTTRHDDAGLPPPRKPAKTYAPPFSRRSWRDEQPQAPQLFCDSMTGSNFLHVEDVQIFSFSATSHDMMLHRGHGMGAGLDDGDGLGVWSPPVVGIFSWMWDHLTGSKATAH